MKVVAATIIVTERVDRNLLEHLVVKLVVYVGFHGDMTSVLITVQNSSSVWLGSVHNTGYRIIGMV